MLENSSAPDDMNDEDPFGFGLTDDEREEMAEYLDLLDCLGRSDVDLNGINPDCNESQQFRGDEFNVEEDCDELDAGRLKGLPL